MEIGKKIRELRIARNLTQEALAAELSVTPQAISKWECGTTTPDIQLLPDIAIFFGVTLDELFCLTDDNELDRIQNQIWDSRLLPQAVTPGGVLVVISGLDYESLRLTPQSQIRKL